MGNCVSCTEPHEQPERWLTDGDKKLTELQTPGSLGTGASGGMSGRNNDGGGGVGQVRDGFGNGSCTPGSTSASHNHQHSHMLSPLDGVSSGPTSVSSSQKAEKKTFYSRIPPLGRSGSDKKSSIISNSTSSSIKDNNNAYSETKIAAVFDLYKDPHEDLILAEGIEKLCKDLEVKPEDFKVLVLAWKFGAEQMCRFTREEFYRGMRELKTDNVKGIQARLPDCVAEVLSDPAMFKDLYRFAFRFGLDTELGQRILPVEMATSLWRVVFSHREPPLLERWISFLEAHPQIRGIPRDTWNMFLNFVETVDNDLSTYDDTEAWPSLFDDFVEYENDRLNQNLTSSINVVVPNDIKSPTTDQQQQQQQTMAIDEFTTTMMTIPPPAPFGDSISGNSAPIPYASNNSKSNSSNNSNNKIAPTSHHHHPQLLSIDTVSTPSGYTKIIHSPTTTSSTSLSLSNSTTSNNATMPVISSHQFNNSGSSNSCSASPTPVSASSYTSSSTVAAMMSAKLNSPTTTGSGSAASSSSPYAFGGYNRELSDV